MGVAENRKTVLSFYDAFNRRELDDVMDDPAPDFVDHEIPQELGLGSGPDALEAQLNMYVEAFPDMQFEALDLVAEDDLVAVRARITGTHRGAFMGIDATGEHIDFELGDFVRFNAEGKPVEHWGYSDNLKLMQQLGVVPDTLGG